VHLFVDRVDRLPELRARLESAGAPFNSFEATDPTVEDLFVSEVTETPDESRSTPGGAPDAAPPPASGAERPS